MTTVTALERALYLVERGYYPLDTDVDALATEIEEKLAKLTEKPKILNDIDTVYIDKTEKGALRKPKKQV